MATCSSCKWVSSCKWSKINENPDPVAKVLENTIECQNPGEQKPGQAQCNNCKLRKLGVSPSLPGYEGFVLCQNPKEQSVKDPRIVRKPGAPEGIFTRSDGLCSDYDGPYEIKALKDLVRAAGCYSATLIPRVITGGEPFEHSLKDHEIENVACHLRTRDGSVRIDVSAVENWAEGTSAKFVVDVVNLVSSAKNGHCCLGVGTVGKVVINIAGDGNISVSISRLCDMPADAEAPDELGGVATHYFGCQLHTKRLASRRERDIARTAVIQQQQGRSVV